MTILQLNRNYYDSFRLVNTRAYITKTVENSCLHCSEPVKVISELRFNDMTYLIGINREPSSIRYGLIDWFTEPKSVKAEFITCFGHFMHRECVDALTIVPDPKIDLSLRIFED